MSSGILSLSPPAYPLNYMRSRRQFNNIAPPSRLTLLTQNLARQARLKLLNLPDLTCQDMVDSTLHRSLFDLSASNSFCSFTKYCPSTCSCCSSSSTLLFFNSNANCDCYYQCPSECSCRHSFDQTKTSVNCSGRALDRIPANIPMSTTHLNLKRNQIKFLNKTLTHLTKLEYLSLANNLLHSLLNDEFSTLTKMEDLDLSSNQIVSIGTRAFSSMFNLHHLYLHNNPWMPTFYASNGEFQSNMRLSYLTYGPGLSCNRSATFSSFAAERPLTADDCCKHSNIESCQQPLHPHDHHLESDRDLFSRDPNQYSFTSKRFFQLLFHRKYRPYMLIVLGVLVLIVLGLFVICCLFCMKSKKTTTKQPSPAERKLLSNGGGLKKSGNHYHKSLQAASSATPQLSLSTSSNALQKLIQSTKHKGMNFTIHCIANYCTKGS